MRDHPAHAEYRETLELLRAELPRCDALRKRAKALLDSILHGDATAEDLIEAVKERKRH